MSVVTNSYQAKWLICPGRRRDIALFMSDFLKTNTNVIHQANELNVQQSVSEFANHCVTSYRGVGISQAGIESNLSDAEDATMPRVKQASKRKRTTKTATVKVLGAAGLGLSLASGASASTMPAAGIRQSDNTSPNQRFVLGEEEMADVSLATFHLFDRENFGSGVLLARGGCGGCGCGHGGGCGCGHGGGCGCGHGGGCGCGHVGGGCGHVGFVGCRGCGGFRGCRGFRGCGCGGCGVSIGVYDDLGYGDSGYGYGACCASWGVCRLC
jgi:hypothetical protein